MSPSGNIVNFPDRSPVEEEAARWVVRLDDGRLTDAERAEFEAWKAVPANADAFQRLKSHWSDLDALAQVSIGAGEPVARRMTPALLLGGAGLAAAALFAVVFLGLQPSRHAAPATAIAASQAPQVGVYQTAVGAQEHIKLDDGSIVTLNTASQIEVRMTTGERSVRLLSGEAFFEVAHDANRPFRVYAGDGVTTAVGTAFSVRLERDATEVVVSKGKVSFSKVADRVEPVAYVAAGQTGRFSNTTSITQTFEPAAIERKLSWTEGRLEFSGDPLSSVVADIARYADLNFEFESQALADRRVGGSFDVGEIDTMLEALETSFGVQVQRVDATHVRITDAER